MLKRTLAALCLPPMVLTSAALAAHKHHPTNAAAARTVIEYSGQVNERTANRFAHVISHNVDRVIGLKITVEPSEESSFSQTGYIAEVDGRQFVMSKSDPRNGGGIEVVTNGAVGRDAGVFDLDGIYIVKSGGMHQGIASFGLQPVDEATVRLNPSVKLVEQPF